MPALKLPISDDNVPNVFARLTHHPSRGGLMSPQKGRLGPLYEKST